MLSGKRPNLVYSTLQVKLNATQKVTAMPASRSTSLLTLILPVILATGCASTSDDIEHAGDSTGEALNTAAEKSGEALSDAWEATSNATQSAADSVSESVDDD
ncbi:hypothetical protein [uncultured Umboniibacter sp.]|uniref:hypothetical protein n=1 Tax=uncultured Umboniibacter sp. TaxID=1798917 RepID=UPI002629D03F|nr:hypothetical protein [uncultured Umboniibacter sp.]